MKRIVCLLPRFPYPTIDGARVANDNFLQCLTNDSNYEVSLICLSAENEIIEEKTLREKIQIKDLFILRRKKEKTGLLKVLKLLKNFLLHPLTPVTYQDFFQLNQAVLKILEQQKYDFIVHLTPHTGVAFLKDQHFPYFYRSENVEYELWEKRASEEKNPLTRFFLDWQAILVKKLELSLIQKSLKTFTIALEDKNTYDQHVPGIKTEYWPMAMHFPETPAWNNTATPELFFLGKLDWGPNRDGLEWFLKVVWPAVRHLDLKLTIAGSGESAWLKPFLSDQKICFAGRVDSLIPYFTQAHVLLVPVFYGSGTRIKVLEAASFSRVSLSTSLGVQGSPLAGGEEYLSANTKEEWIHQIKNLNLEELKKMGQKAHLIVKNELAFKAVSKHGMDAIQMCLRQSDDHH